MVQRTNPRQNLKGEKEPTKPPPSKTKKLEPEAVHAFFDETYGTNNERLPSWQQLCHDLGKQPGTSITQCKKVRRYHKRAPLTSADLSTDRQERARQHLALRRRQTGWQCDPSLPIDYCSAQGRPQMSLQACLGEEERVHEGAAEAHLVKRDSMSAGW